MARGSESRGLHVTCMDPPAELREEQGSEGKALDARKNPSLLWPLSVSKIFDDESIIAAGVSV